MKLTSFCLTLSLTLSASFATEAEPLKTSQENNQLPILSGEASCDAKIQDILKNFVPYRHRLVSREYFDVLTSFIKLTEELNYRDQTISLQKDLLNLNNKMGTHEQQAWWAISKHCDQELIQARDSLIEDQRQTESRLKLESCLSGVRAQNNWFEVTDHSPEILINCAKARELARKITCLHESKFCTDNELKHLDPHQTLDSIERQTQLQRKKLEGAEAKKLSDLEEINLEVEKSTSNEDLRFYDLTSPGALKNLRKFEILRRQTESFEKAKISGRRTDLKYPQLRISCTPQEDRKF